MKFCPSFFYTKTCLISTCAQDLEVNWNLINLSLLRNRNIWSSNTDLCSKIAVTIMLALYLLSQERNFRVNITTEHSAWVMEEPTWSYVDVEGCFSRSISLPTRCSLGTSKQWFWSSLFSQSAIREEGSGPGTGMKAQILLVWHCEFTNKSMISGTRWLNPQSAICGLIIKPAKQGQRIQRVCWLLH